MILAGFPSAELIWTSSISTCFLLAVSAGENFPMGELRKFQSTLTTESGLLAGLDNAISLIVSS
jgi:hypothetical protein